MIMTKKNLSRRKMLGGLGAVTALSALPKLPLIRNKSRATSWIHNTKGRLVRFSDVVPDASGIRRVSLGRVATSALEKMQRTSVKLKLS